MERYLKDDIIITEDGVFIPKDVCLVNLLMFYLQDINKIKDSNYIDIIDDLSEWLEKQLYLCASHPSNDDY